MNNIASGSIQPGVLYTVYGTQGVTYNGVVYNTGQNFRGIFGRTTFTFSGTGTQIVYEVEEFSGSAVSVSESSLDQPVFNEAVILMGSAIEFQQSSEDIIVDDVTIIKGFAMELLDYPFYSFAITETRL